MFSLWLQLTLTNRFQNWYLGKSCLEKPKHRILWKPQSQREAQLVLIHVAKFQLLLRFGKNCQPHEQFLAYEMFKIQCFFSFMPILKTAEKLFQCKHFMLHTSTHKALWALLVFSLAWAPKDYTHLKGSSNSVVMQHKWGMFVYINLKFPSSSTLCSTELS